MAHDEFYFFISIAGETVESHQYSLSERLQVFDVFVEVGESLNDTFSVRFRYVCFGNASVHF